MRTPDAICARVEYLRRNGDDFFGTEKTDLIASLPFEIAKPRFLKDDATADGWPGPLADADVQGQLAEYLDFAFEKALDHRCLSAIRSLSHLRAWCWLLGRDDLVAVIDDPSLFAPYGAPVLARIAKAFSVPVPTDSRWTNMQQGKSCETLCDACDRSPDARDE